MMKAFICTACGIQFAPAERPPDRCPICLDERQYVPQTGQGWTSLPDMRLRYANAFRYQSELLGIGTTPQFAIGQRALLLRAPTGNVLWDCISLIDQATVDLIAGLGGLAAIAISHPHFYSTMAEWSRAFGGVPVYVHAADNEWVMRPDACIVSWSGETREIAPGLTLIRCGGHFDGSSALHWAGGAGGNGAILMGDTVMVTADGAHVAFMRSYPNYLPLGAAAARDIAARLAPWRFEAIYGPFWDRVIPSGGRAAFDRSVARHIAWAEQVAA
jgi:glyoxylase-like metal-dependent hydrolase (beta-lactamase superfamily II)